MLDRASVRAATAGVAKDLTDASIDAAHYTALEALENWRAPEPRSVDSDAYVHAYVRALGIDESQRQSAAEGLREVLSDGRGWRQPRPGARAALADLDALGIRLGIVSNTSIGGVEGRLRESGICQRGDGEGVRVKSIIDSHEAGMRKPDPRIFAKALAELDVEAARALFVGDSLIDDVRGARRAGLTPVHFDPLRLCPLTDHHHIAALTEVSSVLEREQGAR